MIWPRQFGAQALWSLGVLMKIKVKDLQVVLLLVSDPERSDRFYRETLGLTKIFQDRDRMIYRLGNSRLMIHPVHGEYAEKKHKLGWGVALYLEVDNVDDAVNGLRSSVPIHSEPEDKAWGERVAGILDPDGYHIYFTHELPHTWKKRASA
jgi:catechol 2,3-dioxygenase-like lactoylglutathione lyase family enzyme